MNVTGSLLAQNQHRTRRIVWSPHNMNKFIIGSTDLRLYEWSHQHLHGQDSVENGSGGDYCDEHDSVINVNLVAVNADVGLMKCFSWCPHEQVDDLVAVGLTNGKTQLIRLQAGQGHHSSSGYHSRQQSSVSENMSVRSSAVEEFHEQQKFVSELVPRNARACNVVSFSTTDPQLLVTGLDKVRNDCSLLVWDISHQQTRSSNIGSASGSMQIADDPHHHGVRPVQQYGSSEAITSVSWFPKHRGILGAGMGLKWLRLYDTRSDSAAPALVSPTRSIYGMNVDPFHDFIFGSFSDEGVISLWDMRKFTEPILQTATDHQTGLTRIAYDSNRRGVLAFLPRESSSLQLWYLEDGTIIDSSVDNAVGQTAGLPLVNETSVAHSLNSIVSQDSLEHKSPALPSWLPTASTIESRIIAKTRTCTPRKHLHGSESGTVLGTGSSFQMTSTQNQISHSSLASFSWIPVESNRLLTVSRSGYIDSVQLKYAPHPSFHKSSDVVEVNDRNKFSFKHVDNIESKMKELIQDFGYSIDLERNLRIPEEKCLTSKTAWTYLSILEAIMSSPSETRKYSDFIYQSLLYIIKDSSESMNLKKEYIFRILNWEFGGDVGKAVAFFESNKQWENAAAWNIFNGNTEDAVESLNKSGDQKLTLVAIALSGYNSSLREQPKSFIDMCANLSSGMENPYSRGIFSFISSNRRLDSLLNDDLVPIRDRIILAVTFLPVNQLTEFMSLYMTKHFSRADLDAILFTGLSIPDGIELLQAHLDYSGDIQTVAILASYFPKKLLVSSATGKSDVAKIKNWIETYRQLLNRWQLFDQRCKFDIERRRRFYMYRDSPVNFTAHDAPHSPLVNQQDEIESLYNSIYEVAPQIYVRCNFCNQSIAQNNIILPGLGLVGMNASTSTSHLLPSYTGQPNSSRLVSNRPQSAATNISSGMSSPSLNASSAYYQSGQQQQLQQKQRQAIQNIKKFACPTCRKPLPRCSICLLHMDSDVSMISENNETNIDWWFTWCQKCRHGGHAIHLTEWFSRHRICPVSDCSCNCQLEA